MLYGTVAINYRCHLVPNGSSRQSDNPAILSLLLHIALLPNLKALHTQMSLQDENQPWAVKAITSLKSCAGIGIACHRFFPVCQSHPLSRPASSQVALLTQFSIYVWVSRGVISDLHLLRPFRLEYAVQDVPRLMHSR